MPSQVTSIIDYDHTYLQVTNDGRTFLIRKEYTQVEVDVNNTDIVILFYHWYERNAGRRLLYLDFNTVATPSTSSADELLGTLERYIITQHHFPAVTVTSSRTLALTDAKRELICNSVSDITLTIPINSSVEFHLWEEIQFFPYNVGSVIITPDTGVTLISNDGTGAVIGSATITGPYNCAGIRQISLNVWRLCGVVSTYIDPDVQDFLDATGIADDTIITAVNNFIISLKTDGLYARHIALYLVVGGTDATHKINFMNPLDTDAAFRLTYFGGVTHDATGMDFNGTTGYAVTHIIPGTHMTTNNGAIGYYGGEDVASAGTQRQMGCFEGGTNPCISVGVNRTGSSIFDFNNFTSNRISVASPTITNTNNLYSNNRTSSTVHKAFENGTQIGSTDTTANASGQPATKMLLGAVNVAASPGVTAGSFTSMKCSGAYATDSGFSDAEMLTYATHWSTFQTALGR